MPGEEKLNRGDQDILLDIARRTVESLVKTGGAPEFSVTDERLNRCQGAFVTLTKSGELRGCIGRIEPGKAPLWQVVRDMAAAAATEDYRFNPVEASELKDLQYEISVLTAPKRILDWRKIKLGEQGVIVKRGNACGVFLPQVAVETGWDLEEFLRRLCADKAGLDEDAYKNKNTEIRVFSAQVFK